MSYKTGSLGEKLVTAAKSLAELEVATILVEKGFTVTPDDKVTVNGIDGECDGALTKVNLATGDVKNFYTQDQFGDAAFKDFHATQVTLGREIVASNIAVIGSFLSTVTNDVKSVLDQDA